MYRPRRRISRARISALLLFLGLTLAAILAAPRVVEVDPSSEQPHVPANSPIRIRFNIPMDKTSVESRLTIQPEMQGIGSWDGNTLVFRPSSNWAPGRMIMFGLEAGARSITFLPILTSQHWSFTVDKPNMIFLSGAVGKANLNLYDLDRDQISPLTQPGSPVLDYSLSLDRTKVVYDQQLEAGLTEIHLFDLSSGDDRLLFTCPGEHSCRQSALSPDKDFLTYVQHPHQGNQSDDLVLGEGQVWILPLEDRAQAVPLSGRDHDSDSPLWSVKGLLAFYDASSKTIEILRLRPNGEFEPRYSIPNELELLGSWSPDGRYLVFSKLVFPDERATGPVSGEQGISAFYSHVFRLDTLTGNLLDLSANSGLVEDASPLYSPDGEWIAFSRKYLDNERWDLGRQLWLMDASGQGQQALSDDSIFAHTNFAWDPGAQNLASMRINQSDPTEPAQIWVFDVHSGESELVLESGFMPQWVP